MKNTLLLTLSALLIVACKNNEQPSPSTEQIALIKQDSLDKRNKQIALACHRAYERDDLDFIISHMAEDIVNYYEGRLPMRGIDSATIGMREFRNLLKEWKSSNELALAENNYVFVYQNWDGSLKTDSSGQTFHFKAVEIYKFNEEGKIIEHAAVQEQLSPNSIDYFNKQ
jgi:hypothetical protein